MKTNRKFRLALPLVVWGSLALAQDMMVYPNEGQDKDTQENDEFQCYKWGRDQSGFDPMAAPKATEPPPQQEAKRGGIGRGAVRGAAVGAIVDGSDGAKKGAAAGGAVGGMRRRDQKRRQQQAEDQWAQEQAAQYQQGRNNYDRAFAACMEGRGYTVR
jgi:hypothetical protein